MDLTRISSIVRRFLWLFLLVALVAGLTAFFAVRSQPVMYEAKTRLLVGPSMDSPSPDLNSLRIGGQLIQTYAELIPSRPFLESVNNKLDKPIDPEKLAGMIETKQNTDTRILTIFVRHRDPNKTVAIANAIAASLVELSPSKDNTTSLLRSQLSGQSEQLNQVISSAQANIADLEAKLVALGNAPQSSPEAIQANLDQQNLVLKQLSDERNRLSDALRTLTTLYGVLQQTNTNQIQIVEPAAVVYPVNQNIALRVAASALAGLILALCIVFSMEFFSDTIRSRADFNRVANAPLLSVIDQYDPLQGSGLDKVVMVAQPASRAANSYRSAAARLLFNMGEADSYAYLLSSVGSLSGGDTAEVIANLGVAMAQAGKRVVLVDAQFQNPQLTKTFEATENPGLAEYLAADSGKPKLVTIKNAKDVRLLPVGISYEKGSGAALNAAKITALIEKLRSEAEIILIAGSPVSMYAESMNLASRVNGVVLVARNGEAHVKTVNEEVRSLWDMNINLVGIIFDSNQAPVVSLRKTKNVFESAPVVSEDSHV